MTPLVRIKNLRPAGPRSLALAQRSARHLSREEQQAQADAREQAQADARERARRTVLVSTKDKQ